MKACNKRKLSRYMLCLYKVLNRHTSCKMCSTTTAEIKQLGLQQGKSILLQRGKYFDNHDKPI